MYYQSETWAMPKDSIYAAQEALKIGIENSQELLADFETRFGRDTPSNRITAERMDEEIAQMKKALNDMTQMSDTPKTDRHIVNADGLWTYELRDFMRDLERELNAANAEIERLKSGLREERGEKPSADF